MKYLGFRLKLALFIGALALIIFGGDRTYQGLRYREPAQISYDDFVKQKPSAGWFHIKNCVFNVFRTMHFYSKDHPEQANDVSSVTEVYVPLQSATTPQIPKNHPNVSVVVKTSDADILSTYSELAELDTRSNDANPDSGAEFFAKNERKIYVKRDVEGMVLSGLSSLGSEKTTILKHDMTPIDEDFVTLEEGKKPSPGAGLAMLTAGLVLLVGQVLFYIARRGR